MTTRPYKPQGMIKPVRLTKRNPAGGLMIPISSIGAASRPTRDWTWGLNGYNGCEQVRISIDDSQMTLRPHLSRRDVLHRTE